MWRSVPQTDAASTRTRTSSSRGTGTGISSRTRPGAQSGLRIAQVVSIPAAIFRAGPGDREADGPDSRGGNLRIPRSAARVIVPPWNRGSGSASSGCAASGRPATSRSGRAVCAHSSARREPASRTCSRPSGRCSTRLRRSPPGTTCRSGGGRRIELAARLADGRLVELQAGPAGSREPVGGRGDRMCSFPPRSAPASWRRRPTRRWPAFCDGRLRATGDAGRRPRPHWSPRSSGSATSAPKGIILLVEEPELYLRRRRSAISTACSGRSPTGATGPLLHARDRLPRRRAPRGARSRRASRAGARPSAAAAAAERRRFRALCEFDAERKPSSSSRARRCSSRG